ncbi:MAG: hypothetical protein ACKVS9_05870 [Phycisphaerae bacterium]
MAIQITSLRRTICATAIASVGIAAFAQVNAYVPAAGGNWNVDANWSLGHAPVGNERPEIVAGNTAHKILTYNWGAVTNFPLLRLDGSATHFARLNQGQSVLTTVDERIATGGGDAWHAVSGPAFLWVNEYLYVGFAGSSTGHFVLDTVADASAGLYVGDLCYVGYTASGEFDHRNGFADVNRLYIGQSDPGTYLMHTPSTGRLTIRGSFVLGNGDIGTFDHTGGTVRGTGTNGLLLGLNTGGEGTYLMNGGTLDVDHISIAWNGDGYFTQTGGTVTVAESLNIGCEGTHPMRAWYKLGDSDGPAALNVGDDLLIGPLTLAKYEQTGGTAMVAADIRIYDGDPGGASSYLYMGTSAGTLTAQALRNIGGYFDQDGGVLETQIGVNDSPAGMNLDNNADCRIRELTHNAGAIRMWRGAILRGPLAFGDNYFLCEFTNNAAFQMGSVASPGGSFRGHLTNNGTFDYFQGDFSTSRLTNAGTFSMNADFVCTQIVNHAAITINPGRALTAGNAAFASAFENNGELNLLPGAAVNLVGNRPLINHGTMSGGGTPANPTQIVGDVDSDGDVFVLAGGAIGLLTIDGGFRARELGSVRIRLAGDATAGVDYDRLTATGALTLEGELDVRLANGFAPALGDRFIPIAGSSRSGAFSKMVLPTLGPGLRWDVTYGSNSLRLAVIANISCPADIDRDGTIGLTDLAILLSNFGGTGNHADGDLDQNGLVNLTDLATLLTGFGSPCP